MKNDLTAPQEKMLLASAPDDVTGQEGAGIELRTGADYKVANALKAKDLGHVEGPGGVLPGMYWNNAEGLSLRREILRLDEDSDED